MTDPAKPALVTRSDRSRHAQELVGMRHRHRVSRFRRARMAHAAHDADLRPVRPGEAEVHPQFRPCRPAAGRDRRRPVELHGPISTGPKGNRVYFGYGTNKAGVLQIVDRAKLLAGPPEPTAANLAPGSRPHDLPPNRRAHGVPAARDGPRRVRARQGRADARLRRRRRRVAGQRVPRAAADGVRGRRHRRIAPVGVATFNVPEASGNFCARGGRFGSHSSNENQPPMYASA